ncbi:MAG: hypothetical protein KIT45_12005 [Fimbriimonadia bacterium]|nr:hypothetical protein [Fimbriimonadia bacterium]
MKRLWWLTGLSAVFAVSTFFWTPGALLAQKNDSKEAPNVSAQVPGEEPTAQPPRGGPGGFQGGPPPGGFQGGQGGPPPGGFQGGPPPGGQGFPGGQGRMGGPGFGGAALAAYGDSVYVLRGEKIYRLDAKTLKMQASGDVPFEAPRPRGETEAR